MPASQIYRAAITLDNDQIKTLPTVPQAIVPATEVLNYSGLPNQLFLPVAFSVTVHISDGAYTNVDSAAKYVLAIGSDWSINGMEADLATMAQLASTTPQIGIANSYNANTLDTKILALHVSAGGLQDNALALVISNGALGNLTDGNAANTMDVSVFYIIVDV